MRETHVAAGASLAALTCILARCSPLESTVSLVAAALSSTIPDLDTGSMHRALLHNLVAAAALALLTLMLPLGPLSPLRRPILMGVSIGYLSHLLLDMLTVRGVALFYPFTKRRFKIMKLRANDPKANTLLTVLFIILLLLSLLYTASWRLVTP